MLIPNEKNPVSVPLSSSTVAEPNAVEPSGGPFDDQDDLTLQENPPAYSPSAAGPLSVGSTNMTTDDATTTAAGTTDGAPAPPFPAERSAANFVTIKCKDRTIRDAFVIDPTLPRPHDDLVSPPDGENADKNLYVMCKDGTIAADVWLVGRSEGDQQQQQQQQQQQLQEQPKEEGQGSVRQNHAALDFQGKDADVMVNLRTLSDCTYDLNVKAKDCKVSVAIPPSFVGPVILEIHDSSVKMSDRMKERLTTFSDINKKRSCFMGDFKTLGYTTKDEWKGSSIKIYTKDSRIRLSFVDEQPPELPKGFFAKLLHGKEKD